MNFRQLKRTLYLSRNGIVLLAGLLIFSVLSMSSILLLSLFVVVALLASVFAIKEYRGIKGALTKDFYLNIPPLLHLEEECEVSIDSGDILEDCDFSIQFDERIVVERLSPTSFKIIPRGLGEQKEIWLECNVYSANQVWAYQLKGKFEFRLIVEASRKEVPDSEFAYRVGQQKIFREGKEKKRYAISKEIFSGIRPYVLGDSLRQIDARKSARYQMTLSRQFESSERRKIIIAFDLGRGLLGSIGNSKKLDYYLAGIIEILRVGHLLGDELTLIGISDHIEFTYRAISDFSEIEKIRKKLLEVRAKAVECDYSLLFTSVFKNTRQRSLIIIFTDLLRPAVHEALLQGATVTGNHHLVVALSVLPDKLNVLKQFTAEQSVKDMSRHIYSLWLEDEYFRFRGSFNQYTAGALLLTPKYWLSSIDRAYQLLRESPYF